MTNKNDYDYSEFAGMGHNQPKDLIEVAKLAEEQYTLQVEVLKLEAKLEETKESLRIIAERKIPEKMEELGLADYTTTTGIRVEVKEKIRGSLPVENRPKGFDWLEKNGFGGLIESEIIIGFRRDQLEEAKKLVDTLILENRAASLERNVHHARLDGFIREQLAQGKDIPLDIFGVFRQRIAKVGTV